MAKHNWSKLKIAFINGNYKSLKDFAQKKNIPYKTLQQSAVGWVKEKQEKDREKTKKIQEEVYARQTEREISLILSRNDRVLNAEDKLLEVYESLSAKEIINLAKKTPKAFVSLTAGLVNLQKIHRVAEGLDKAGYGEDSATALDKLCAAIEGVKNDG